MQENYKILGVSSDASDQEIEEAYLRLKKKYSEDRFIEGDAGNVAAKKLTKIENAYKEITNFRKDNSTVESGEKADYFEVESAIKSGDISGAQRKLDDITTRNAEWHYLQSVIFYKKNWYNESKKQLEIAINLEPHNQKYSDAYTKLKVKLENYEQTFRSGNVNSTNQSNAKTERQMGDTGNECLSFCTTWCCMNLLCNICCH